MFDVVMHLVERLNFQFREFDAVSESQIEKLSWRIFEDLSGGWAASRNWWWWGFAAEENKWDWSCFLLVLQSLCLLKSSTLIPLYSGWISSIVGFVWLNILYQFKFYRVVDILICFNMSGRSWVWIVAIAPFVDYWACVGVKKICDWLSKFNISISLK